MRQLLLHRASAASYQFLGSLLHFSLAVAQSLPSWPRATTAQKRPSHIAFQYILQQSVEAEVKKMSNNECTKKKYKNRNAEMKVKGVATNCQRLTPSHLLVPLNRSAFTIQAKGIQSILLDDTQDFIYCQMTLISFGGLLFSRHLFCVEDVWIVVNQPGQGWIEWCQVFFRVLLYFVFTVRSSLRHMKTSNYLHRVFVSSTENCVYDLIERTWHSMFASLIHLRGFTSNERRSQQCPNERMGRKYFLIELKLVLDFSFN